MLDVIGAGATASSNTDWHQVWLDSKERDILLEDLERIHSEGRSRPQAEATLHTEFASSWGYQTVTLFKRDMVDKWRNPTYLMAKLTLNIIGGLFIGREWLSSFQQPCHYSLLPIRFTFFRAKNSIQGTQNKLFVSCFC